MDITTIISWISTNGISIITGIAYIVSGATVLAKLTPTQTDDNLIAKFQTFFEKVSNMFLPDISA